MLKAWSITTTVRNPERLRDFLIALKPLAGKSWAPNNQENYQKLLIKNRLYGYGNQQFYAGLPTGVINAVNNIDVVLSDKMVDEIIEIKQYTELAMRGRQSLNPLTKFGFVMIEDGKLSITDLGNKLIESEKDSGDAFLKSFIKWQIPNPASRDYSKDKKYNIVPFVGALRLIDAVNALVLKKGGDPVGISKREFCLFVPTLIDFQDIQRYADEIIEFRDLQKSETNQVARKALRDTYRLKFAQRFLNTNDQKVINKFLKNIKDYGDNAIRYFRLTKFIRIRGNGFYIDLEPNRQTEIQALFEDEFYVPRIFSGETEYQRYMADDDLPRLPWQTKERLLKIATDIIGDISSLKTKLGESGFVAKDITASSEKDLIKRIEELRIIRKDLLERENHVKSQPIAVISEYIEKLENIHKLENRPTMLEYLSTMGLHALNDAIAIQPNYPVGDDNEPTSTAPGGVADIECLYRNFNMICEVTLLNGRDQWHNEGQPVMRHLRDFENKHPNSHCLFIAPTIHTDTAETFWIANTHGYKGRKQSIVPITLRQFVTLLKTLKSMRESQKEFTHDKLLSLMNSVARRAQLESDSDIWIQSIQGIIDSWVTEVSN